MQTPADLLATLPLGTRVVVRRRTGEGFADSLGDLVALDASSCTVRTRSRGDDVVMLGDITAARTVPPAPPRRSPRRPPTGDGRVRG
ncbi:hypothetical protein E8P82_10515 [Arthrobacter echini]|uniref:Ferrous iron transport protein A n=1 Tax=Arthrobacter echini TaxID=1529066 RepID=A0A4S5E3P0_9MICC|nr:hypothetical protein [Arthrobacter echini]THJ66054.1 hypothetical protein E8P82_10515 [Arthrobacter echini]